MKNLLAVNYSVFLNYQVLNNKIALPKVITVFLFQATYSDVFLCIFRNNNGKITGKYKYGGFKDYVLLNRA